MTDTVIKGTGNSRSLKTVPNALTLYPNFNAMLQAMIDGTFPIDLGPINPTGVNVKGTDINKATLLKDATAALYGLGTGAVPDDVLALHFSLIEAGNYKGTGVAIGSGNPIVLNFGISPQIVFIASYAEATWAMFRPNGYANTSNTSKQAIVSWGKKSVSFYTSSALLNANGQTFYYVAIG